jgi:hypothetical protein
MAGVIIVIALDFDIPAYYDASSDRWYIWALKSVHTVQSCEVPLGIGAYLLIDHSSP